MSMAAESVVVASRDVASELTAPLAAFVDDRDGHNASTRASQITSAASLAAASAALAAANAKSRRQLARVGPTLLRAAALLRELRADLEYIHTHSRALEKYVRERCPEASIAHVRAVSSVAEGKDEGEDRQKVPLESEEEDAIRESEVSDVE